MNKLGDKGHNLTGRVFGHLTVKSFSHTVKQPGDHYRKYWLCVCKCGTERTIVQDSLLCGYTKSCGCANHTDIAGKKFGRWLAVSYMGESKWQCQCDCGTIRAVTTQSLVSGASQSCGCYKNECSSQRRRKHGKSNSPEFRVWVEMIRRCSDQKSSFYHRYGGRGISVCDRWKNDFQSFYNDMGPRPSSSHSIERKNNNGNYEPDNCVWATQSTQSRNTIRNTNVTYNGKTMCAKDWSKETGISGHTIVRRLAKGWTPKQVLETPPYGNPADYS